MINSSSQTKKPSWLQIIRFGEELSKQSNTEAICELTVSAIQNWFTCQANLCLLSQETANYQSESYWQGVMGSDNEIASLIQKALSSHKIAFNQQNGNKPLLIAPLSVNNSSLGYIKIDRGFNKNFLKKEIDLLDGLRTSSCVSHSIFSNQSCDSMPAKPIITHFGCEQCYFSQFKIRRFNC